MAYDKSTGVLTIDNANETFDVILDNVATALSDYRVTEVAGVYARDVGLLCTSPNVNRNSVRRPIYTPIDKLGMETEAYLQSQMYGFKDLFNNSKNYTKLGYSTTQSWFDAIAAKGAGADLWGDSLPNGGYYVINQFNQYYNKATSRKGYINDIVPVTEIKDNRVYMSPTNTVGYMNMGDYTPGTFDNSGSEIYLNGLISCTYTIDIYYAEDLLDTTIIFNGYLELKDIPESGSTTINTFRFDIDTTGKYEGNSWIDSHGNSIYWQEAGHITATMNLQWMSGNADNWFSLYESMYNVNQKSTYKQFDTTHNFSLQVKTTAELSSLGKSSSKTDNTKKGIWFTDISRYFSFDYRNDNKVGTYEPPSDYILSVINNNLATTATASRDLLVILKIYYKSGYAPTCKIINPYARFSSEESSIITEWNGLVLYSAIGIGNPSLISHIDGLICYGRASSICPNGYADISAADSYMLFQEQYGFGRLVTMA